MRKTFSQKVYPKSIRHHLKYMNLGSIIFFIIISLYPTQASGDPAQIKLETPQGYRTEAYFYAEKQASQQNIAFVYIHGKMSSPTAEHNTDITERLNSKGYRVIAPFMPWGGKWDGSFQDGLAVIEEAVKKTTEGGKKVVVIGHSLGGRSMLHYATETPHSSVIGIVSIVPGHHIHRAKKILQKTQSSREQARAMVRSGRGNEFGYFYIFNTGKLLSQKMTAQNYLSFYDPDVFPNVLENFSETKTPLLVIGDSKSRGKNSKKSILFNEWIETIKSECRGENVREKSQFISMPGDHRSVTNYSVQPILEWAETL